MVTTLSKIIWEWKTGKFNWRKKRENCTSWEIWRPLNRLGRISTWSCRHCWKPSSWSGMNFQVEFQVEKLNRIWNFQVGTYDDDCFWITIWHITFNMESTWKFNLRIQLETEKSPGNWRKQAKPWAKFWRKKLSSILTLKHFPGNRSSWPTTEIKDKKSLTNFTEDICSIFSKLSKVSTIIPWENRRWKNWPTCFSPSTVIFNLNSSWKCVEDGPTYSYNLDDKGELKFEFQNENSIPSCRSIDPLHLRWTLDVAIDIAHDLGAKCIKVGSTWIQLENSRNTKNHWRLELDFPFNLKWIGVSWKIKNFWRLRQSKSFLPLKLWYSSTWFQLENSTVHSQLEFNLKVWRPCPISIPRRGICVSTSHWISNVKVQLENNSSSIWISWKWRFRFFTQDCGIYHRDWSQFQGNYSTWIQVGK